MTDTANRATQATLPAWARILMRLIKIGWGVAAVLTAVMGAMIILDVLRRNTGFTSLPGTVDMTAYWWMPPICFLTMGIVHMRNEQIRVTLLTEGASETTIRWSEFVIEIFLLALVAWFTWLQIDALLHAWDIGEAALGARWVVKWPSRLAVVIALLLLLAGIVLRIYSLATGRPLTEHSETVEIEPGENV